MNDNIKGVLFGVVAAVTYGMNPLFALPLYQEGLSTDSVLFYRYMLGLAILGGVMKLRRQSFRVAWKEILPLAAVGILVALSSLFLFLAYQHMYAGIASTILFVYPVMVAVVMAVFFREKAPWTTWVSIALALAGIALLSRGGEGGTVSLIGVGMVMISAAAYAFYIVGVKKSRLSGMAGDRLTFYALLFGLSIFWVRLDFGLGLQVLPSWSAWGNAVALGVVPTVVSLLCTALAIRYVGATPTAILGALEPVTAVFFGILVFHEELTFRLAFGIVLIIAGVILLVAGKPAWDKLRRR